MVAQFVTLQTIAKLDVHIQHRHDAVHHPLAAPVDESEVRIRDQPKVLCANQFLDDAFVVILDGAHARCLQPAHIAAHAVRYLHVGGVENFLVIAFYQGANLFRCGKANIVWIILLGVLFWAGEQTLIREPRPQTADGLWNLYKPLFYLVPFLLGYFVFSHDAVQEKVKRTWIPLMASALVAGGVLVGTTFGQDNTTPEYLGSPLNCIYGWMMCLALMGWFQARFDRTGAFAGYMTRSSFGLYIVHYLPVAALGYMMKTYTQLPPMAMYLILTVAVFTLSPLLYELIRRIPFVRWCVFGEKM